jgi:hypothetical protein
VSELAEARAILLRLAVGFEGFLGVREIETLLHWLGDLVTRLDSRFAKEPAYSARQDGGFILTVPTLVTEALFCAGVPHELGHGFVSPEEADAWTFADALRLPRHLVLRYLDQEYPDWEGLLEDSGCDRETVERRVSWMRFRDPPSFRTIPRWSAIHSYLLAEERTRLTREIVVTCRQSGAVYRICPPPREFVWMWENMQWALVALRPEEFALRHAVDLVERRGGGLFWEDLQATRKPLSIQY